MKTFSAVQKVLVEATKRLGIPMYHLVIAIEAGTDEDLDFLHQAYLASDKQAALLIINKYIQHGI